MAVLSGYYDLFAMPFWFFAPTSKVFLRFWTGTWHWHYTGSSYEPEWSGWRRSFDIVSAETSNGNIHQDIAVPYPGTEVRTPATFDPPGVITQPNPVNNYGTVVPYDVVDFYARPQLCAQTTSAPSYARLDFSLIDVPFVRYSLETGYYL